MSRVGKLAIKIPDKVSVAINHDEITVKGPRGELTRAVPSIVKLEFGENILRVGPNGSSLEAAQLYGTYRSLINNMVRGVLVGFEKRLELQGVGYRSQLDGKTLVLSVGYSHPVNLQTPDTIKISVENNTTILVSGIDKELVGQVAANIRLVRPPEPYKGKGIRYQGEYVRRKVGKAGKK
jgi:large subunit ribosomal protein L6